jgi:hypothetical protein
MMFDLSFSDDTGAPARCRAAVILYPSGAAEIAVLEVEENTGRSVTNSWPSLAQRVLDTVLPAFQVDEVIWYEVYPDRWRGQENVSRVLIAKADGGHRFEYEQNPVVRRRIWEALALGREELEQKFSDFGRRR